MRAVVRIVTLAGVCCLLMTALGCGTGAQPVGRNADPVIEIVTGPGGASYAWGEVFAVEASVSDEEDDAEELSVVATAGGLALGEYVPDSAGAVAFEVDTAGFEGGVYTLLLKVVDTKGASINATDEFTVCRAMRPRWRSCTRPRPSPCVQR